LTTQKGTPNFTANQSNHHSFSFCGGRWGGQSGDVFEYLSGDFMKPRIDEVRRKYKH